MKNTLIIIVVVLVVGIGIYFISHNSNYSQTDTSNTYSSTNSQTNTTYPVIPSSTQVPSQSSASNVAGPGEHCGGNMTTARVCSTGYHCTPTPGSHLPFGDVGGMCVKD